MKKKYIIILIIAAVLIIAAIIYFMQPQDEETTDDTGITYYPDGSYSYLTEFESGQINQYTVDGNGNISVTTIQQGTHEATNNIDPLNLPIFQNGGFTGGITVN